MVVLLHCGIGRQFRRRRGRCSLPLLERTRRCLASAAAQCMPAVEADVRDAGMADASGLVGLVEHEVHDPGAGQSDRGAPSGAL
eukprot:4461413-Pyramimonas_sp.AAC.1